LKENVRKNQDGDKLDKLICVVRQKGMAMAIAKKSIVNGKHLDIEYRKKNKTYYRVSIIASIDIC